ncbi:hypothetical protein ACKWTF_008922 [Chironomus riparius]
MSESMKSIIEANKEILKEFEEWTLTQPHIPKNIKRIILFRYLKVCDFNLEESKKLLDINIKFRVKHQYLFRNRDVDSEEFQRIIKAVHFTRLPKLSKEGYSIEIHQIVDPNASNFNLTHLFRACFMIHDMNDTIEHTENGVVAIFDAEKFTFQHLIKLLSHPSASMHFLQYGQEATCMEIKQVHIINCSSVINRVVSFLKPFFTKELYEKLHLHTSGYETLHNFVDKDCLPIEFGGCEGSLNDYMEDTLKNLHIHRDFVSDDKNFFLLTD